MKSKVHSTKFPNISVYSWELKDFVARVIASKRAGNDLIKGGVLMKNVVMRNKNEKHLDMYQTILWN